MEVIGVIAAIPGLIDIVTCTKTTVQGLVNRKIFLKETTNLVTQLDLISQILVDIKGRWSSASFRRFNLDRLLPAITSLKNDLQSLNSILAKVPTRSGPLLLKQAVLMISGVETKIKHHSERLEKTKSLLTLIILAHGDEIAEESLSTTRANLQLELRDLLRPCDHSFIPQNLSGTCEWIWTHPVFSRWLAIRITSPSDLEAQIMCIYGTKGCGKSVLAASIVNRFKAQDKVAALFSFWAGRASQRKLVDFLRTLLWHLLQRISDKEVQTIFTPLVRSLPINESNLGDAIKKAGVLVKSDIYCVLDAIDESTDDWSRPQDGCLKYVVDLVRAIPNLRLVLIGREPAMRAAKTLTTSNVEITEDTIRHDIGKFVDVELDRSLKVKTPPIRELVRQSFQEKSTTMFLWVSLVFTELNRCYLPSEIVQTLEHTPHDLDREYHRLFAQLIARLGGSTERPSIFLQRTKRLLSLIIAAPEPLTCDELRHAFALCQHPQQGFEGYLIEPEGIIDSVGDFVRVSDGRYHIAHASLIEFLTRDLETWRIEDEPIIFFRIDMVEAHTSMCLACFDYLTQSDLGYPMTDKSLATLPERLVFFRYASRELPNHAMEVCAAGLSPLIESKLVEFRESTQCCAFIEYVVLCFQHDEWTLASGYLILFGTLYMPEIISDMKFEITGDETQPPKRLPDPDQLLEEELRRREAEFGTDHARCQSWRSVMTTLRSFADRDEIMNPPTTDDPPTHEISVEVATGPMSDLPHHLNLDQRFLLKGRNRFVNSMFQYVYRISSKFPVPSADILPIPLVLLFSTQVAEIDQKISLLSGALKRVKGQKGLTECLCLLCAGLLLVTKNDVSETTGSLLQSGLDIAVNHHLPQIEWLVNGIMLIQAMYLDNCGKRARSRQVIQQLRERLLRNDNPIYLRTFRMLLLGIFEIDPHYYMQNDDHEEAFQLEDPVIAAQEKQKRAVLGICEFLLLMADSLCDMKMYEAAEYAYRKALCLLDKLNQSQQFQLRWATNAGVSDCLYEQYKDTEARDWIQQIDLNMSANNTDNAIHMSICDTPCHVWHIGRVSAWLGELDLARRFFQKALTASCSIQGTTTEPRVDNLKTLAEALEVHRPTFKIKENVMVCCRLIAEWDEEIDCLEDPRWWRCLAIHIRRDDADLGFDAWDIVFLKCVDMSVAKFGVLSNEAFVLYYEMVNRYELDGEHEAASAVLQDFIIRHTSASRGVPELSRTDHGSCWSRLPLRPS
ncbi:hypothetical protein F5Y13DRAFT_198341 [Hypoxylon sp. FL1857]|nr:hypothetical protein F5Y13DRAFT_198341 [Hypoxylon sp. FL1857]